MSYSRLRFGGAMGASTAVTVVMLYLIASSVVSAATLPIVGIGGFFITAETLTGENSVIYPQMGSPTNSSIATESVACEQRPMLAINVNQGVITNYRIFKDIELPFVSNRWMSIVVDETDGGQLVSSREITIFNTQLEADWLNITNVELTEGGMPYAGVDDASDVDDIDRAADYVSPDADTGINPARDANDASNEIWGPNSGEFLMITDPRDDTNNVDTVAKGVRAWVHGIAGEDVRFIAGGAATTIELRYVTDADLQNRYASLGVDTRDPAGYDRRDYFDCVPP